MTLLVRLCSCSSGPETTCKRTYWRMDLIWIILLKRSVTEIVCYSGISKDWIVGVHILYVHCEQVFDIWALQLSFSPLLQQKMLQMLQRKHAEQLQTSDLTSIQHLRRKVSLQANSYSATRAAICFCVPFRSSWMTYDLSYPHHLVLVYWRSQCLDTHRLLKNILQKNPYKQTIYWHW